MVKRLFDIVLSFVGLLMLTPLFVICSYMIMRDSEGPVLFRQERVGRHGRLFVIHKFRTMKAVSKVNSSLTVGKDSRITDVGHWLRRYKLDELPQLFDVLLGHMSIVGPRPEIKEFIDIYPINIRDRVLSVRPGITDMAAIEMVDENKILGEYEDFRKAYVEVILPIKQKLYIDYVNDNNVFIDIKIIFLTFKKILSL